MKKLLCLILSLFILCGCGVPQGTDTVTEAPRSEGTSPDSIHTVYFPDDKKITYSQKIEPDELVFLDEIIKTNTTEITVKNTGDIAMICRLYYPDDYENEIQTHTLEPGKKVSFSNLTSKYDYCISFQSEEGGTIEAKISG